MQDDQQHHPIDIEFFVRSLDRYLVFSIAEETLFVRSPGPQILLPLEVKWKC